MIRGIKTFRCSECDHVFRGPDIEYTMTVFSAPLPCRKCRSIRTYPSMGFSNKKLDAIFKKISFLPNDHKISIYKRIWERMEKNQL